VTPRDLQNFSADIKAGTRAVDDFRYKGFPDGQWESPRNPLYSDRLAGGFPGPSKTSVYGEKHQGLPNLFDTSEWMGMEKKKEI
jgi:hypothetical protein